MTRPTIWPYDGDPRHGTINGYTNLGCRCAPCREANRVRHLAWMNADPQRLANHAARMRAVRRKGAA